MTNFQRLATVRTRFLQWLQDAELHSEELGPDGSLIHRESMLVRDEFFCGRKFHAEHYTAVWFIEEDALKIHRADGSLELALRGSEIDDFGTKEEAAVERHAAAAELQLPEESDSEQVIAEHAPKDDSKSLEIEPRILKLTAAREEAEGSIESSASASGKVQPDEQQTGGLNSGEQEIRKAA